LIAEYARAARLEHDDGRAGGEVRRERIHRVGEIVLCPVEHAEVVQRPAAARVTFEHAHAKAGARKHVVRGFSDVRLEIVGESIGPEEDLVRCATKVAPYRYAP